MKQIKNILIRIILVFSIFLPITGVAFNSQRRLITYTTFNASGNILIFLPLIINNNNLNDMVYIPAGEFQMGCDPNHNGGFPCPASEPLHTVYLDSYFIDKYEVTNAQYKQCVDEGVCNPPKYNFSYTRQSYFNNTTYSEYPVILVTWYDAYEYCSWVGGRLPTEEEWEKAARGSNDTRAYPWGDQSPNCALANHDYYLGGFTYQNCVGDTSKVGSYLSGASPYGALDMAGNVWEWVNDWYINRSGSWDNTSVTLRVSMRVGDGGPVEPDDYSIYRGFRCARTP